MTFRGKTKGGTNEEAGKTVGNYVLQATSDPEDQEAYHS
jgi:hypothetical protein